MIITPVKKENTVWLASFDIGSRNFAFYIEETSLETLNNIKNIKKEERYNEDGTPTSKMCNILNTIYDNGKTILHKNSDLTDNKKSNNILDNEVLYNMNDLLDKYGPYWDNCEYFVIEQQMQFGKFKRNPKALKLGHHCQSYFMFRYGRLRNVVEFPAYHKTQILGCKKIKGQKYKNGNYRWKSIDKPSRKKWAVTKATEILSKRKELHIINDIKRVTKKDDLADTLIQLQAFKYITFVDY